MLKSETQQLYFRIKLSITAFIFFKKSNLENWLVSWILHYIQIFNHSVSVQLIDSVLSVIGSTLLSLLGNYSKPLQENTGVNGSRRTNEQVD